MRTERPTRTETNLRYANLCYAKAAEDDWRAVFAINFPLTASYS